MIYFAHRGSPKYVKENTIASFEHAQDAGRDYFETDVHQTLDGVLVLHHDPVTAQGFEIAHTPHDVLGLPTLNYLLKILRPEDTLNIEIKTDDFAYPDIERNVLDAAAGMEEQIIISSFNYDSLLRVRAINKDIRIGLLGEVFSLKKATSVNAYSINMHWQAIDKETVDAVHKNGMKLFAYTVNDNATLKKMEVLGIDGVFTDDVYLTL